jgi:nicotinate-nucleotide pyrophosphorylase (carboxylating)
MQHATGDTLSRLHQQATILARLAREEDLGTGDLTAALVNADQQACYRLVAKQKGVFAGREIAGDILATYGQSVEIEWCDDVNDGTTIDAPPRALASLRGPCRAVLEVERVLLNFLQRLSGIATATRTYVEAIANTDAHIYDTRKTTPGWRALEKYAVRCGGARNHRQGLYDAVLIKDNHIAGVPTSRLASHVFDLLSAVASASRKPDFIEIEVDSLEQLDEVFKVVGIDVVLLDNFPLANLCQAVALRDGLNPRGKVALEASGGITLDTVRAVAETGVDRISVGAITHSVCAMDISLDTGGAGDTSTSPSA